MELLLISSSKLKVTLSESDMQSYSLTCDTLDYDNTETRRAFWDIFDVAKHETGFDAASDRVFIQVYPSKSGGCEMYITKLINKSLSKDYDNIEYDNVENFELNSEAEFNFGTDIFSQGKSKFKEQHKVFKFLSMEDLLKACDTLMKRNCCFESSVFFSFYSNEYFLVIYTNTTSKSFLHLEPTHADSLLDFINEYGEAIEDEILFYSGEYIKCLCDENAVEILGKLAL